MSSSREEGSNMSSMVEPASFSQMRAGAVEGNYASTDTPGRCFQQSQMQQDPGLTLSPRSQITFTALDNTHINHEVEQNSAFNHTRALANGTLVANGLATELTPSLADCQNSQKSKIVVYTKDGKAWDPSASAQSPFISPSSCATFSLRTKSLLQQDQPSNQSFPSVTMPCGKRGQPQRQSAQHKPGYPVYRLSELQYSMMQSLPALSNFHPNYPAGEARMQTFVQTLTSEQSMLRPVPAASHDHPNYAPAHAPKQTFPRGPASEHSLAQRIPAASTHHPNYAAVQGPAQHFVRNPTSEQSALQHIPTSSTYHPNYAAVEGPAQYFVRTPTSEQSVLQRTAPPSIYPPDYAPIQALTQHFHQNPASYGARKEQWPARMRNNPHAHPSQPASPSPYQRHAGLHSNDPHWAASAQFHHHQELFNAALPAQVTEIRSSRQHHWDFPQEISHIPGRGTNSPSYNNSRMTAHLRSYPSSPSLTPWRDSDTTAWPRSHQGYQTSAHFQHGSVAPLRSQMNHMSGGNPYNPIYLDDDSRSVNLQTQSNEAPAFNLGVTHDQRSNLELPQRLQRGRQAPQGHIPQRNLEQRRAQRPRAEVAQQAIHEVEPPQEQQTAYLPGYLPAVHPLVTSSESSQATDESFEQGLSEALQEALAEDPPQEPQTTHLPTEQGPRSLSESPATSATASTQSQTSSERHELYGHKIYSWMKLSACPSLTSATTLESRSEETGSGPHLTGAAPTPNSSSRSPKRKRNVPVVDVDSHPTKRQKGVQKTEEERAQSRKAHADRHRDKKKLKSAVDKIRDGRFKKGLSDKEWEALEEASEPGSLQLIYRAKEKIKEGWHDDLTAQELQALRHIPAPIFRSPGRSRSQSRSSASPKIVTTNAPPCKGSPLKITETVQTTHNTEPSNPYHNSGRAGPPNTYHKSALPIGAHRESTFHTTDIVVPPNPYSNSAPPNPYQKSASVGPPNPYSKPTCVVTPHPHQKSAPVGPLNKAALSNAEHQEPVPQIERQTMDFEKQDRPSTEETHVDDSGDWGHFSAMTDEEIERSMLEFGNLEGMSQEDAHVDGDDIFGEELLRSFELQKMESETLEGETEVQDGETAAQQDGIRVLDGPTETQEELVVGKTHNAAAEALGGKSGCESATAEELGVEEFDYLFESDRE